MNTVNFKIESNQKVSEIFKAKGISDFHQAMTYVMELPYKRNNDKKNLLTVFADNCGTCSTKHALLKLLADENNFQEVKLILSFFRMNGKNTPSVNATLKKYKLEYIPEAHNYLRYHNERIDVTKANWGVSGFMNDVLLETEILPDQITDFKVSYHKDFLAKWLQENNQIPYGLEEFWEIREECIKDLYS